MPRRFILSRAGGWIAVALLVFGLFPEILRAQTPVAGLAPVTHGIQRADMDLAVDPAVDFYRYANGGWLDRTAIPPDLPAYGVFGELDERTEAQLLGLLGDRVRTADLAVDSDPWKAVQFYRQGLDLETRNAQGIAPILAELEAIAAAPDLPALHALIASPLFVGLPDFFNIGVDPKPWDSSANALSIDGPQLGLFEPEYYTERDPATEPARIAYRQAAANLFVLAGMSETRAFAVAQAVYDFEAAMAAYIATRVAAPHSWFTTIDGMQRSYPLLDWLSYVRTRGATVDGSTMIESTEPELFENLHRILESTPLETVKNYLSLQWMLVSSNYLSEDFQDATFPFFQAVMGVEQQEPTDEEVLVVVNQWMGDAVGQVYVAEFFPPEARDQIIALVEEVMAAFRSRLESNVWMGPDTTAKALQKLDRMRVKVGYPNTWRSYADVEIGDSFYHTFHNAYVAEFGRMMATAGQPVDREEWFFPPQIVNAYYYVANNEIVFPAAVLQPPIFDPEADPAANYGAIGFLIGHEIIHGFDPDGSRFDANGNRRNWWTKADKAAFQVLNDEVVAQYSAIEVLPGMTVDGELTVVENVADLGGVQVAFDALKRLLASASDPGLIDGLTQQQRFFIAAASVWREIIREEFVVTLLTFCWHAPAVVRGTLPLQNMDAFHEAFEIEPGDPMYLPPVERIVIW